jgi:aspartokinase/homoserine dehydrogenase 1
LTAVGDKIQKIEAALSGTLSYLFNSFDGREPFSNLVRLAQEQGFTEPDPRADLSGMDVARKLLILIRESGLTYEMKDIQLYGLLPSGAEKAGDLESFYKILKQSDADMNEKYQVAKTKGQKLCFIASYDGNKAEVGLNAIDQQHPFFGLKGSDNIVSIYTNLYKNTPLVIRGPGAGTEITAAGVFTDILRAANLLI